MKGRRRERERETRSRVADLQTEAIRLRRELEVGQSPHSPLELFGDIVASSVFVDSQQTELCPKL